MCGILGSYLPEGEFPSEEIRRKLEAASKLLAHRGPDADGLTLRPKDGIAFAHRRLAILDLDPRSNQPMESADGSILITFNGEIYNFREIREELRRKGRSFKTGSDTEVLIQGYAAWGMDGLLARLAGMFAFALYDAAAKNLYLVRDRAGKKPLFYCEDKTGLDFASELGALLALGRAKRELDPAGLDAFLALKFVPSPRTLLTGVSKVPPGCYLRKHGRAPAQAHEYWNPFKARMAAPADKGEALERLDAALAKAMERRMVSDVPVCLFLSGGVDSSLIASYLVRGGHKNLRAYTIGYRDLPDYNEFDYSRLTASRFGLDYREIAVESRQALELLESGEQALDEPIADWVWLPLAILSRQARAEGFKVALLGEGSDELFFGYDVMMTGLRQTQYFDNPFWRQAARLPAWLLAPLFRRVQRGHHRYDLARRLAGGEPAYLGSSVGFVRSQRSHVAGPRLLSQGDGQAAALFVHSCLERYARRGLDPRDLVNSLCFLEFYSKMGEMLLTRVDRVTMRHSLEARAPFLDHELVELAFAIPGDWKIPDGRLKGLLKELAARSLPEPVISRPKAGFSFPFKEWLRADLGPVVESAFKSSRLIKDGWLSGAFPLRLLREHRSGWQDHAPRIWMLYDLCRWYDRWIA